MDTVINVSDLRIRTPPPDESPSPLIKKKVSRIDFNTVGLVIAFYLVGVLLTEAHSSTAPNILIFAAISIIALMPICMDAQPEPDS
jgi:hypothetical protein